jgi:hypothetical protein
VATRQRPNCATDKTILAAPDLGALLNNEVHLQTGDVRGQSDAFGWERLDPLLDPFASSGVDDEYFVRAEERQGGFGGGTRQQRRGGAGGDTSKLAQTAPAGWHDSGVGEETGGVSEVSGVLDEKRDGRASSLTHDTNAHTALPPHAALLPAHAQRHVTWGGGGRGADQEEQERGGGEHGEEWEGEGVEERERAKIRKSKTKVRFSWSERQQIAPAYLLPKDWRLRGQHAADDEMLGGVGSGVGVGALGAIGRDGRAIGLGSSIPSAVWQQLRRGEGGGASGRERDLGTGGDVTSVSAHTPYTHTYTPYTSGHTHTHTHTPASTMTEHARAGDSTYTSPPRSVFGTQMDGDERDEFYGGGERGVGALMPSEVASLQRLKRLDAKLGYFRDAAVSTKQSLRAIRMRAIRMGNRMGVGFFYDKLV